MMSTVLLLLEDFEVWTVGRSPSSDSKAQLAQACGATYVSSAETPTADLAAEIGGFDVVMEATGDAQVMLSTLALLGRNGVACLLGLDGRARDVSLDGRVIGVDSILQNRALVGSVNAHRDDWLRAVEQLDRARERWPEALDAFVGLRVPLDRFTEAFDFRGVKATLALG